MCSDKPVWYIRDPQGGLPTLRNSYTFTGYGLDGRTGLYYAKARYYRPELGRFMSQDTWRGSAWAPWTQNLYAYVGNNPVNYIDPTGHSSLCGVCFDGGTGNGYTIDDSVDKWIAAETEKAAQAVGEVLDKARAACHAVLSDCEQFAEFMSMYTGTPEFGMAVESVGAARATNNLLRAAVAESEAAIAAKPVTLSEILANPRLLDGMSPDVVRAMAEAEGWEVGTLGRGGHVGEGLTIRDGRDILIQWHPGGGRHGSYPYWKFSSGKTGTLRFGPQFLE